MDALHSSSSAIQQPHLEFYGGRILENPRFVSLYAGSYWATSKGSRDQSALTKCSQSIPSGPHSSVWQEYGIQPGTYVGSTVLPLARTPKIVSEREIQQMVAKGIASSSAFKPDGNTVYTVFLPPKTVLVDGSTNSRQGLGGFHGSYVDSKTQKPVYYSAIVYADKGNGVPFTSNPVDNMTIAASHEWSEVVTDPNVNRGRLGWYDRTFGEIGDIPISMGYDPTTVWGRIDGCAVQKEWSNAQGAPVLKE